MKILIFRAEKNLCMLHGRVFVMPQPLDPKSDRQTNHYITRLPNCAFRGTYALVICNHGPPTPGGVPVIAVEMSGALTKVLPRQCGGSTRGLLYNVYRQKGQ